MTAKIKVIKESTTGLNTRISVNGESMTNNQAYNKAKKGEISGHHGVINADGKKYIRSNPDKSSKNNIEK